MSIRMVAAVLATATFLVLGPAVAQAADVPDQALAVDVMTAEGESGVDAIVRHRLAALVDSQSTVEIAEAVESGGGAVLMDENGEVIAALDEAGLPARARAISWLSPGCAVGSACVTAGSMNLGFTGTGVKSHTMSSVTKFYAGDKTTVLWKGANYWAGAPGKTVYLTKATSMDSISRS
ncbi:hypothetical protein CHO01_33310 [Cellulomonas hominis]|uniref:Uncharacterized protein n=1 Tax=Cellulomonas hominis TaxID=156981 RepID=A0A511FG41_9CELL|nr:hypothetical protein [Cellulomonas hominis]GEL48215.1 hypothetical protein CHO01_33310 [Cellulomonas hominis]